MRENSISRPASGISIRHNDWLKTLMLTGQHFLAFPLYIYPGRQNEVLYHDPTGEMVGSLSQLSADSLAVFLFSFSTFFSYPFWKYSSTS